MLAALPTRDPASECASDAGRGLGSGVRLKAGRYEVLDVLAGGGMGVLLRARDHRCGGNVVLIKSIRYDIAQFGYDRDAAIYHVYLMRQQFKREKNVHLELSIRGVRQVPGVVDFFYDEKTALSRTYAFGRFSPRSGLALPGGGRIEVAVFEEPYLVMERIMGTGLRTLMGTISERGILEVALAICHLLSALHAPRHREDGTSLAFVYMDLKPDNLIVDPIGGVWLLDFGGASPMVDGVCKGSGCYTPGFAAPEVRRSNHRDAKVDGRADLYGVGAILFQALSAGRLDPMTFASAGDNEFPVLPLSQLRPDLQPGTQALVSRALSREPAMRFDSAEAMRCAIEEVLRESR
jgi:serine/threonine protein kinase